ncbi:MAG TPA: cytochrome c oxidase subunit 3 [Pseudomonadales bacterium]
MASNQGHASYYVPESTRFPFFAAMGLGLIVLGAGGLLNDMKAGVDTTRHTWMLLGGFGLLVTILWNWFGLAIRENLQGLNSAQLKHSYVIGMQWFIFSEVMFFAAFFGALFYVRNLVAPWLAGEGDHGSFTNPLLWSGFVSDWASTNPTPQQALLAAGGEQYIAMNGTFNAALEEMSWKGIPLWNTILLVSSSFTVHLAHHALKAGHKKPFHLWLAVTLILGFSFVYLQGVEYHHAYTEMGLTLKSGIYGTTFFMLTGFHGFHVCMGALMLTIMFLRSVLAGHFTPTDHFGFEAASWYWHFVDVVWIGLFLFVYIL